MAYKSRDDYSEAELKKFHSQLSKAQTKEDRAAIFKQMNAMPQAVGQWFRHMKLEPLGAIGGSAPKKRGRPAGSQNTSKAKPGRPKGTTTTAAPAKSSSSRTGISREARETLIRLLEKLLND